MAIKQGEKWLGAALEKRVLGIKSKKLVFISDKCKPAPLGVKGCRARLPGRVSISGSRIDIRVLYFSRTGKTADANPLFYRFEISRKPVSVFSLPGGDYLVAVPFAGGVNENSRSTRC